MAERKWGAISNGATFEALATTIVFFEDPNASLFGRRGKDGGQDARSGDGALVFQAKHHKDGSAASAIRDAKKEVAKIHEYRQPGHSRYSQWTSVTKWRLVTNAIFNPKDKEKWDKEVVPLFAAEGLASDYWERENLNSLLDRHPEIHRSFFENETRAFLSAPEIRERLPAQEPFLRRDSLGEFCGRSPELATIRDFLASEQLFLVVHGAGGIGKTRLLVESGEEIAAGGNWQVLWANVASMSATAAWFEAVVPERPTLLLIDEPPDELVLQQLAEQLGGRVGRTTDWKVAIAVRSPKDPVLRFLRSPRMLPRVRELPIGALLEADAQAMCENLLATGKLVVFSTERRADSARELSRRFGRHPVWLTLAVHLLEDLGDLSKVPSTAKGLADEYLAEIERAQSDTPVQQIRALLRWIALIGLVNRDDDSTIKILGDQAGIAGLAEVRRTLAALVARRVLIERGARNRFVELKPDVLRDHVLFEWLTTDVGYGLTSIVASEEAKSLIVQLQAPTIAGTLSALGRAILLSLSRTEMLLRLSGHAVPLLASFFDALRNAAPSMTASQRLALTDVLETIAFFHPGATAAVVDVLRTLPVVEERVTGILRERIIGQDDVILALAWPLFHAAMGAQDEVARETVLRQLCALVEAEAALASRLKYGLPNDGKRAAALVERVLEGGPQFWSDFDATALKLGRELLTALSLEAPTVGRRALLKALVEPAVAVERRQTWSDKHTIHFRTFAIGDDHPGWTTRNALLVRVKELLSTDATPSASRAALWLLVAEAHRNVNRLYREGEPKNQHYYQLLLEDLAWARQVLERRAAATIEELSAARELWDWHHRFDSDPALKATSDGLEALYYANELAHEFEPLLSYDEWQEREARSAARAAQLAQATTPDEIVSFVDRAVAFLGKEHELHRLSGIAWALGQVAQEREPIARFVMHCLQASDVTPRTNFGVVAAASWVASRRKVERPGVVVALVRSLLVACGSDDQRANLLLEIYGRVPRPGGIRDFSAEEIALFHGESARFLDTGRGAAFIEAFAADLSYDWDGIGLALEDILRRVTPERQVGVFRALIQGVYWAVRDADPASLPAQLGERLLNQLLMLRDLDDLGGNAEWHLDEIFKRVGRARVSWLPQALAARRDLEEGATGEPRARALSYRLRLSKYISPILAHDVDQPAVREALDALLEFVGDDGSVGYHLPEALRDVDPEGVLVPNAVAARLGSNLNAERVRRLARIGGAYVVGTPAWRTVAKAAIAAAATHGEEDRHSTFSALGDSGFRSWSARPGEVPAIFASAVARERAALEAESDVDLKAFWAWRLAAAEAELCDQEERAKEERGE